ncbi:MAG TPA: UDP-N-acetylmuramate--L-alanine ligase [Jatrophihabitans sp.]|nr:UDP-N-acetylmuramate--L-alanine ligase [Jatrophihabitans sp.]
MTAEPPTEQPDAAHRHQSSFQRPADWAPPGAALVASAASETIPAAAELGRIHLMGIAGSGMSALARLLLGRGFQVSGCENKESATVADLRALGAQIAIGHSVDHLDGIDTFVYTTAINPKHVELVAARERGLLVIRRAAALGALVAGHRAVAIAGTHGKTSTTSLLTVAAIESGLDPSFAIGANLHEAHTNGHVGGGDAFIVEADESDGSFLLLAPDIAVITNVEADHLENYGDLAGVVRGFEQFVERIRPGGLLVVCSDDPTAEQLGEYGRARGLRVRRYGMGSRADVRVHDVRASDNAISFTVSGLAPQPRAVTVSSLVGGHMALNASAALVVLHELAADPAAADAAWRRFGGVDRRFELRGTADGVRVYDDYAHHPTEVRAQLEAAQAVLRADAERYGKPKGRLIGVFQPGTYSRTQTFAAEFGQALAIADAAVVLDIFPAREEPIPGVSGAVIADRVPLPPAAVQYQPEWSAVPDQVATLARPGDLVLTMGIGDVHLLCPLILRAIEQRSGAQPTSDAGSGG